MIGQDLRYAIRTLLKRPGFAAVAIVTLGLAIGANSAIFSVVSAVLLRPLPYPEPERLAKIVGRDTRDGSLGNLSPADFMDLRDDSQSFASMGAHGWVAFFTITGDGEPERISGSNVTDRFFPTIGVQPLMGRLFEDGEDERGAPRVAIITHAFWERRFGADPETLGRVINFNAMPTTIVGILPPDYRHPEPNPEREPEVYIPYEWDVADPNRGGHFIRAIGRLEPDVPRRVNQSGRPHRTGARAAARCCSIGRWPSLGCGAEGDQIPIYEQLYERLRPLPGVDVVGAINILPLSDNYDGLLGLFAAVAVVLALIGIYGVIGCLVGQRTQEIGIRMALGAESGDVIRMLLWQGMRPVVLGVSLGLVAAFALSRFVATLLYGVSAADPLTYASVAGLLALAAMAATVVPALRATRIDPSTALRAE